MLFIVFLRFVSFLLSYLCGLPNLLGLSYYFPQIKSVFPRQAAGAVEDRSSAMFVVDNTRLGKAGKAYKSPDKPNKHRKYIGKHSALMFLLFTFRMFSHSHLVFTFFPVQGITGLTHKLALQLSFQKPLFCLSLGLSRDPQSKAIR